MQLQLPIFPEQTKLINSSIGFFNKDDFIFYLHNGSPIFCHAKSDRNSYRYILANLVVNNMCGCSELSRALGINVKNVQRYVKDLREHGMGYFFNREDNRGQCHKFTTDKQAQAQKLLDTGYSQQRTAKELNISESAIRYHLREGNLKKNYSHHQ
jgi:DNA-binding CsgD family transcriptional regulator